MTKFKLGDVLIYGNYKYLVKNMDYTKASYTLMCKDTGGRYADLSFNWVEKSMQLDQAYKNEMKLKKVLGLE